MITLVPKFFAFAKNKLHYFNPIKVRYVSQVARFKNKEEILLLRYFHNNLSYNGADALVCRPLKFKPTASCGAPVRYLKMEVYLLCQCIIIISIIFINIL